VNVQIVPRISSLINKIVIFYNENSSFFTVKGGINLKYNLNQDNLKLKDIINEEFILDLKGLVEFIYNLIYISNYEKMSCLLNYSLIKIIMNIPQNFYCYKITLFQTE
jgi:hypothetical protein